MTDAELLAAQHRVIVNYASCSCNMQWKHGEPQPLCPRCKVIEIYNERMVAYDSEN